MAFVWAVKPFVTIYEFSCLLNISYYLLMIANYSIPNPNKFDFIAASWFIHKCVLALLLLN